MLVLATLGAAERRRQIGRRKEKTEAQPEPEPVPVTTGRATVVDVSAPLADLAAGRAWLAGAGEPELAADLAVLNRALHAFRLVTADPYLRPVSRGQMLAARVGFGAGERVADGLWTEAHELVVPSGRRRRGTVLQPQARFAAVLGGREQALVCEELVLRARLDVNDERHREAALQLLVALDAALAELAVDPTAAMLTERLAELRAQRDAVATAAQAALAGRLSTDHLETVTFTLGRIEAALRARVAANA